MTNSRINLFEILTSLLGGGFVSGAMAYADSRVAQELIGSSLTLFWLFMLGTVVTIGFFYAENKE